MDRERADRARGEAQALRDTLPSPEPINSGQEWPEPMADDAFHGPMGELARRLAPHVEVNAEAILITGLVGFGNMIGRNPSFLVALDEHRCNLFAIQVGKSSRARKGMSWNLINGFLKPVDPEWATYRTGGGLSTGEGLIRAVEDEPDDENGQPVPQDKRQCFVETEFETVLDRMTRPGNTLSGLMRQAWDGTTMRTKTKDSPMTATDPHVSIVGHVTLKALRRKLDETDRSNGLGNRILWFCSERTEYIALPKAINPADDEWSAIVRALKAARTFASRFPAGRSLGSLLDREAQKRWEAIYDSYEREEDDDEAV
ncbi:MAG: hypothetical protein QOF36_965, partial [Microbacteriaceae bacterium]|nr:hypothetical protein [Microbacteriaceae bacterium]